MKKIIEKIISDAEKHGSIPFWSWNDRLEDGELRRQIRNMKGLGMRGFFMHARAGLETEYMSEEWFHAIETCIDEAKKLGMEAWAYDENGWPSGFAGGALLNDPANFAKSIVMKEFSEFPEADENILAVYTVDGTKLNRVTESCGAEKYYAVIRESDFSYVDIMDGDIVDKFISETHEVYKKRLDPSCFGKEMPGFFTDEPQYFRYGTAWSDTFLTTFKERFGYDVRDGLAHMFIDGLDGGLAFKYDYRLICHEQYYSGFMKRIYDWCNENGVQLTGHSFEEWGLSGQMMGCGGVMPFYMYEHIPGIDYLCRGIQNISGPKQLGSVCEQTGKKVAMSEMYACCGWDVSPRELKRIAELQYAGGVNLTCEHLYAYSERGQRKRDYPNHYSEHNPWQKYYPDYERHFKHLGSALSQGKELVDTLVIHPIRTAYFYYPDNMAEVERKYREMIHTLTLDHIFYHFGDETVMKELASVEGNKIRVGECLYDKVLLPNIETLDANTASVLREYLANGGKITIMGNVPERIDGRIADLSFIKENMSYDELKAVSGIDIKNNGENIPLHMQIRNVDGKKLIFITNTSENEYLNTEIRVPDCRGFAELDIDTLEYRSVRGRKNSDGSVTLLYDFTDSASCVLVESDMAFDEMLPSVKKDKIALGKFTLETLPENVLLLDKAEIAQNGGKFTEERPIVRIRDNLLKERFEGSVSLKYSFDAEILPKTAYFVVEPMKYTVVTVNGKEAGFAYGRRIDRSFKLIDIAKLVKLGKNEVVLTFDYFQSEHVYNVLYGGGNEALRNCLCFDTEIEAAYLYGDFGVASRTEPTPDHGDGIKTMRIPGPFYLTDRNENIELIDIVRNGYPFFAGEMTASTVINYKAGDPTTLRLGGRYSVCCVSVNGKALDIDLFADEYELAPYLNEGENKLTLTLCFSNRNLLGPHNRKEEESFTVFPAAFSFEKEWDGENCPGYVDEKSFVRFGIDF